jgi:hypothetical protein
VKANVAVAAAHKHVRHWRCGLLVLLCFLLFLSAATRSRPAATHEKHPPQLSTRQHPATAAMVSRSRAWHQPMVSDGMALTTKPLLQNVLPAGSRCGWVGSRALQAPGPSSSGAPLHEGRRPGWSSSHGTMAQHPSQLSCRMSRAGVRPRGGASDGGVARYQVAPLHRPELARTSQTPPWLLLLGRCKRDTGVDREESCRDALCCIFPPLLLASCM